MPELPEVETIVRKLKKILPGKSIQLLEKRHPKTVQGPLDALVHRSVTDVSRRSKIIRIHLSDGQNILIHLKMTGQLIFDDGQQRIGGGHPTADWVEQLPGKHTRAILQFSDGSRLFFNDQRLFGWWRIGTDEEAVSEHEGLGPDATDPSFTSEYLQSKIANRSVPIKQLIMDNTIVAGVGNIYACDALNVARLSPFRAGKSLTADEVVRLSAAIRLVINQGVELGGTTFDGKYVDIDGLAGKYQSVVRVYGREGQACQNCGGIITKAKLGGRGTYYCPVCQV